MRLYYPILFFKSIASLVGSSKPSNPRIHRHWEKDRFNEHSGKWCWRLRVDLLLYQRRSKKPFSTVIMTSLWESRVEASIVEFPLKFKISIWKTLVETRGVSFALKFSFLGPGSRPGNQKLLYVWGANRATIPGGPIGIMGNPYHRSLKESLSKRHKTKEHHGVNYAKIRTNYNLIGGNVFISNYFLGISHNFIKSCFIIPLKVDFPENWRWNVWKWLKMKRVSLKILQQKACSLQPLHESISPGGSQLCLPSGKTFATRFCRPPAEERKILETVQNLLLWCYGAFVWYLRYILKPWLFQVSCLFFFVGGEWEAEFLCVMTWNIGNVSFSNISHRHRPGNGLDADGVKLYCGQMGKNVADRAIQVVSVGSNKGGWGTEC